MGRSEEKGTKKISEFGCYDGAAKESDDLVASLLCRQLNSSSELSRSVADRGKMEILGK